MYAVYQQTQTLAFVEAMHSLFIVTALITALGLPLALMLVGPEPRVGRRSGRGALRSPRTSPGGIPGRPLRDCRDDHPGGVGRAAGGDGGRLSVRRATMPSMTGARAWLARRDPGLLVVRRAARVTLVACTGFLVCRYVFDNA